MDDAKKLIHWAINLPTEHSVEIQSYDWPERYGLSRYDFQFKFTLNKSEYRGRGCSANKEIALVKAIVEAIERTSIPLNSLYSSNGIAAHFDSIIAKENALCELIERDVFLCNYLLKHAGITLLDSNELTNEQNEIVARFITKKVAISIFKLGSIIDRSVVLVLANGFDCHNKFGCVVGLGASKNICEAIDSALIESVRNIVTLLDNEKCDEWYMSEQDFFCSQGELSIQEHGRLALTENYGKWLWEYFHNKQKYKIRIGDINEDEIFINELKVESNFSNLGLNIYRAQSVKLQNLFFNRTEIRKLNLIRLNNFFGEGFSLEELNFRTHPLA